MALTYMLCTNCNVNVPVNGDAEYAECGNCRFTIKIKRHIAIIPKIFDFANRKKCPQCNVYVHVNDNCEYAECENCGYVGKAKLFTDRREK